MKINEPRLILLPHYRIRRDKLIFLNRETVEITDGELEAILSGSGDAEIIGSLEQKGIVTFVPPIDTKQKIEQLVVEAHSDDAALSMGGYLLKTSGQTKTGILDVFSTCGTNVLNIKDPIEMTYYNNEEEKIVSAKLNAELYMLNLPESAFRYPRWNSPFDPQKDRGLVQFIKGAIMRQKQEAKRIFFPLAIGDHPDHSLLFSVFLEMERSGMLGSRDILFYEDLPYAAEHPWTMKMGMTPKFIDITESIQDKIRLLSIYKSQYCPEDFSLLKTYAQGLRGDGRFYERFWELKTD